ncbi:MAG: hypothetical protein LBT39_11585 [Treponema sp.]|jgi:hypothetical protein|nr:hypothetical protein [Treponema sp.]
MPVKKLAWLTLFMALAGFLAAQAADEVDRILATPEITCSQAARFVLAAARSLPDGGEAFAAAKENRWLPGQAKADDPIRLGELAQLIMGAFDLRGGIMYNTFPVPRYACRTLVYKHIIRGRTDPDGRLDGRAFLQILSRVLSYTGEGLDE